MRTKHFRLLTVLLTAVMLVALSLNVFAASSNAVTQDGLTAQLFTDKDSYKAGESVKASVQMDNHTGREVFIFTQINVPEGVKLASESAAFDARLKDGETWITPGGVSLVASNATAGTVATGDNMQAGFYVILIALAVGGIFALLVYGKNRKTWLSVLLCMAMLGGMVVYAVPTQAADMNGDILLSCAIQVDGKDTEITATVSYVIYDDVEEEAAESTVVPTATPVQTPEATETPTEAPVQTPEATETPTEAPTATPEATETPTEAPTEEPTPTPTIAPTEEPSPTPTWDEYYSSRVNPDDGVTTRLEAILGLVDNALTYGRNLEGSYYPQLFVDGINVNTKEPLAWVYEGDTYYYSNFWAQQNLMRILDGLTVLSGDPKYREIAHEQYRFHFDNLVDKNGLVYAGPHVLVDVMTGRKRSPEHETKDYQLPWELMWAADPEGTKRFIEAYWNTHVYDMSSVNFNRHGYYNDEMGELWDTEYLNDDPYVEAEGEAIAFTCTGNDLLEAAYFLAEKTGDNKPKEWADRMLDKFIAIQDDNTGLVGTQYGTVSDEVGGDRVKIQFKGTELEKYHESQWLNRDTVKATAGYAPQALLPVYEATGDEKIYDYVTDNMLGVANHVYLEETHAFDTPMLTDGYDLGGFVNVNTGYYGTAGQAFAERQTVFALVLKSAIDTYAVSEDKESVKEIWEMARAYAKNVGFGDIGSDLGADDVEVNLETTNANPFEALAAVSLYKYTKDMDFYNLACKIGDNIVAKLYHDGFFVTEGRANAKFDTEEAYAVFVVEAMSQGKLGELVDDGISHGGIDLIHDGMARVSDTTVHFSHNKVPVTEVAIDRERVSLYVESGNTCAYPDTVGHRAEAQIRQLSSLGVLRGKADGKFYPDEEITCDEVVTLVKKLCNLTDNSFVPSELADNGTQLITREELAAVLVSALKAANPDETYYTADALYRHEDADEISAWARDYVDIACNYGLVDDVSEDIFAPTFAPKSGVTRAQAADSLASLYRFIEDKGLEKLSVEIEPAKADDDVVTWSSSNPYVVDVDGYGNLYPISIGEAEVTATVDGVSDTIPVKVKQLNNMLIKSIRIDGVRFADFEAEVQEYDVLLPLGTESVSVTAESFDGTDVIVILPESLPGTAELYLDKEGSPKYEITFDPSHIEYAVNENFDDMEIGTKLFKYVEEKYNWDIAYRYENHCKIVAEPGAADATDNCIEMDYLEESTEPNKNQCESRLLFPNVKYLVGEEAEDDNLIVCDFDIMVTGGDTDNFTISFGKGKWNTPEYFMNTSAHRLDFDEPNNELNTYLPEKKLVTNFTDGEFLNIKFVMNKKTQKADYYVNGERILTDVEPVIDTLTEIDGLMFYMHNGFDTAAKMYVDNIKIYDVAPNALEESFTK